jgi:hypothetical protein
MLVSDIKTGISGTIMYLLCAQNKTTEPHNLVHVCCCKIFSDIISGRCILSNVLKAVCACYLD